MSYPAKGTPVWNAYFFDAVAGGTIHPMGSSIQDLIWYLDPNESFTVNIKVRRSGQSNSQLSNMTITIWKMNVDGSRTQLAMMGKTVPEDGNWSSVMQFGFGAQSTTHEVPIYIEFKNTLGLWEFRTWLT